MIVRLRIQLAGVALLVGLAGAASAPAQDHEAERIIGPYAKAAGGSRTLSRVRTLSLEGALTASDGSSGTYTLDTKLPNRYYSEIVLSGKRLIESYNGKSAWREDSTGTIATMTGPEAADLQAAATIANLRLLNLKKNKIAASFAGHTSVRGKDALQLRLTAQNGAQRDFFFDPESHLVVKESGAVGGAPEELLYDDYRSESGVQVPHKIELHRGGETFTVDVAQVVVNGVIGERVFDLPVASQVRLPDLKALFKEIDDHQKAIDKLKEDYAGTRVEDETEYDANGKVKERHEREYSFFYFHGEEISTLRKKDAKPLSDAEQKKETENAQKRIEEIQKSEAKKEAQDEKARREGKEEKDDDGPGIETFLRTCQFVNPRRERFRGQDVLVFDFEANPEYRPRNWVEKIVQKLAGVVWIDERAHDVVRLEAYFANDARIAGGLLASVQKGTGFVFEQAFVNDEVWLPTYEEARVGARVLLVKGFRGSEVTRYSDYKKYHVDVQSKVGAPKAE